MKTVDVKVTGKTKIGSHIEGKGDNTTTVNDYTQSTVVIPMPENITDDAEYFGAEKYAHAARERITTRVADRVRKAIVDARATNPDISQTDLDALAKNAVKNFPTWLSEGRRKGEPRKTSKVRARETALITFESAIQKPYDKWSDNQKNVFNTAYPSA